jgi:hypothetical protein
MIDGTGSACGLTRALPVGPFVAPSERADVATVSAGPVRQSSITAAARRTVMGPQQFLFVADLKIRQIQEPQ